MIHRKVCCISSGEEVRIALAAGATALGFVSSMPSGPGVIPEETIVRLVAAVPPPVATFLLTSLKDPAAIVDQRARLGTNTVQLCDAVTPADIEELRRAMPGVAVVPVIHVTGEDSLGTAREAARHAHALLLDSGRPDAAVKELGGTGRTHDWDVSARIVRECGKPVFLAGGLRPDNVAEAVRRVRPWGVDVCSGVRTDGALDDGKLRAFLDAVTSAS
jgi:phosphoribosylanthranilate isomerase